MVVIRWILVRAGPPLRTIVARIAVSPHFSPDQAADNSSCNNPSHRTIIFGPDDPADDSADDCTATGPLGFEGLRFRRSCTQQK